MKKVDNLDAITAILQFDSEDDFYHLQIIKRKKEHPELGSNSYVVKTYYISSVDYLMKKYGEIQAICDYHNARACINLNRRSYEKMAFQLLRKVADQIMNRDYKSARKAYESVCGTYANEPVKKWIIDIDDKDMNKVNIIINDLKNFEPNRRERKDVAVIETKSGYHIISTPFNMQEFTQLHPSIDVHKDNPTVLYMPL
jgi:hypothetical protein